MKLALNTATLGHNIDGYGAGLNPEQVIDLCAEKKLDGVVFWRREFDNINHAQKIGDYAKSLGFPIIGLCRTPYLIGREADLSDMQASIDMALALDAPILTIVVGGVEPNTKGIKPSLDILTKRLEQILPLIEHTRLTLALEPLHPALAGNRSALTRTQDAVDIIHHINHDDLKIAIDIYHVWWDLGLKSALERSNGKIAGFHLCDWLEDTSDCLLDRGMMGDGVADIRAIRHMVEHTGYDGIAEVEIFSKNNWWQQSPSDVIDTMIERFKTCC